MAHLGKKKTKTAHSTRPTRTEAEAAVRTLIQWIGEDPKREGLHDTPARVIRAFEEYYVGYEKDPAKILSKTFKDPGTGTPVLIRNIAFESRCEHHMAPFIGHAHVAYIPNGKIIGLSKIARIVDAFARRMQVQERLTLQIAAALQNHLKPKGVAVLLAAEHFCMKVRGVHKNDAITVTSQFTGAYKKSAALRAEFLAQTRES